MNSPIRLEVSIDDQRLDVFDARGLVRSFPVSTAAKGIGFREGSYRTPTGRFRISEKIGGGEPIHTIFKKRVPAGSWRTGKASDADLVLTRILRLEGLDPENANTMDRFIYIHGTNREDLIGRPASMGCVRLSNPDMLELYEMVSEKDGLIIRPPSKPRGKLIFFDCDSTLSAIEGIDELAGFRGPDVYAEVVALTDAAMNGEVPLNEVFPRRMEIIRPNRETCEAVARKYIETVTPGAAELISELKANGWLPVILSGGFAPLIVPLAKLLGIDHVEAVPLYLDAEGNYAGYGTGYPTTRNLGKNEIIREWKAALSPERTAMMGDGISDLETTPDVDVFVGFGGVIERPMVKKNSPCWITSLTDRARIMRMLADNKAEGQRRKSILSRKHESFPLSSDSRNIHFRPMSTSPKKAVKGKRYTPEEKKEIIAFVEKFNADNGRGGQSTAAKKYGISQLSIATWLKKSGAPAAAGGKRGRKPGSVNKPKSAKGGSYAGRVSELSALANQIDKAEAELEKLKAKFHALLGR